MTVAGIRHYRLCRISHVSEAGLRSGILSLILPFFSLLFEPLVIRANHRNAPCRVRNFWFFGSLPTTAYCFLSRRPSVLRGATQAVFSSTCFLARLFYAVHTIIAFPVLQIVCPRRCFFFFFAV